MSVTTRALLATSALAAATLTATGPAGATTVPACTGAGLSVYATPPDGAAGHGFMRLLFRNKTSHTCTLRGYPGLDAQSSTFHVLAHAQRTLHGQTGSFHSGVPTVTLLPDHLASASVEWSNSGPGGTACHFSHYVAVTPANTATTHRFARAVSICDLQVHPTLPGSTGVG